METAIAPFVENKLGRTVTNSRAVAEFFGKRHADVLRAIDGLDCSCGFNERNFASVEYRDNKGETRRAFDLTKDGFVFLVMGFTGPKAARFKEAPKTAGEMRERAMKLLAAAEALDALDQAKVRADEALGNLT